MIRNNKIHLEVGNCGVKTIDVVLTAEVFSGFLSNLMVDEDKDFLELVRDHLTWDKAYTDKIMANCK